MDKRRHREEVQGVRLGHVPGDLRRVSCGVAKCSKKAFDEIQKAILFGDFGIGSQGVEGDEGHPVLAQGKGSVG